MDIRKRRRQAAWACFEPYLAEEQMIQAIQILERGFQIDGTMNLISYVTEICTEFDIDSSMNKMLYSEFYKLVTNKSKLLTTDPLPLLLKKEQTEPIKPTVLNDSLLTYSPPVEAPKKPNIPVHCLVFAHFMHTVFEYVPDKIELSIMLESLVIDKKLKSEDLRNYVMKWLNNPSSFGWSKNLSQQTLARLVHLVYMSLCEVLGPIAADDCFHKALIKVEQIPEAKIFSPSQFL